MYAEQVTAESFYYLIIFWKQALVLLHRATTNVLRVSTSKAVSSVRYVGKNLAAMREEIKKMKISEGDVYAVCDKKSQRGKR